MRRARAAATALLVLMPSATFAQHHTAADGHVHQTILLFGPGIEADCVAMRDGKEIFRRHSPWDEVPAIDADIIESQGDILLTCTRADRTQVSLTLHWGPQSTLEGDAHGFPPPCARPYRLDEKRPTDCWVDVEIAYPRHVSLHFDAAH